MEKYFELSGGEPLAAHEIGRSMGLGKDRVIEATKSAAAKRIR